MATNRYALIIKVPEKDKSRRRKSSLPGPPFKTLEDYLRDVRGKGVKSAWTYTRNMGEIPIEDAHKLMVATASRNPYVKKPALHLIASFRPGLRPGEDDCKKIAARVFELFGLAEHQAMVGADDNRAHFHLHLVANIVHPKTYKAAKIREGWIINRAIKIARQIEREFAHILPTDRTLTEQDKAVAEPASDVTRDETTIDLQAVGDDVVEASTTKKRKTDAEIYREGDSEPTNKIRSQLGEIPDFKTWKEADEWFRNRSCEYKTKGAGAVIRWGKLECKASVVSRQLSLSALSKRLGPPQAARLGFFQNPPAQPPTKGISELKTLAQNCGADRLGFYLETEHSPKHVATVDVANVDDVARTLRGAEARGENVLVTPLAADKRFLPVHGLTPAGAERLQRELEPAVIIGEGDSYAAFIAVERSVEPPNQDAESAAARETTAELQAIYAPHVPSLPPVAPLPAPGFRQTSKRKSATATLLRVASVICRKTTARFKRLVQKYGSKAKRLLHFDTPNGPDRYLREFNSAGPAKTLEAAIFYKHLEDMALKSTASDLGIRDLAELIAQRLRDGGSSRSDIDQILAAGIAHVHDRDAAPSAPNEIAATVSEWITSDLGVSQRPPIPLMALPWKALSQQAAEEFRSQSAEQNKGLGPIR